MNLFDIDLDNFKTHLINDSLIWLPSRKIIKIGIGYHIDTNIPFETVLCKSAEGEEMVGVKSDFIKKFSPLQVDDEIKIVCKECKGYRIYDNGVAVCTHCTRGQQSYKIVGPIELIEKAAPLTEVNYSHLSKPKTIWYCTAKVERIDK